MAAPAESVEPPDARSAGTTTGVVKFFKPQKGWGAISTDETAPWDVWCHFSSIESDAFRQLHAGQLVMVDYERRDQDSFRYVATRVAPLD